MTFSYVGIGSSVTNPTTVSPSIPAAAEPGNLLIAVVDSGHPTSSTQPSTPAGWRLAGTTVGTVGTYGVDTGPRRLSLYMRVLQSGDSAPTFTIASGSESRIGAVMFAWSWAANESVQWEFGGGQDSTSGVGFSATTTAALALSVDDVVHMAYVATTDAVTWSGQTATASGVTFAAATELSDASSVVGADSSRSMARSQVTAGSGTGAVTLAATMSSSAIGVAGVIRLRDTAAGATAAVATASYDDTLARVLVLANGMSSQADVARVERSVDGGATWTTVRGATAAPVVDGALVVAVSDFEFTDQVETVYRVTGYDSVSLIPSDIATTTITPELFGVWLKSTTRPFLNAEVDVRFKNPMGVTSRTRTGVFDVIGRTYPVAVSDVRKSQQWTMYVRTESYAESEAIRLLLASGDVVYVHTPSGCPSDLIPGGYAAVGDALVEWHPLRPESRLWTLPMTEVAAPSAEIAGAVGTYQTVLDGFLDYTAVAAAHSTYAELLALVGSPTEVIVP